MQQRRSHQRRKEGGIVLISSLLLLLIVTVMALSMFRSFGVQEKIAGNMREKQRALPRVPSPSVSPPQPTCSAPLRSCRRLPPAHSTGRSV